MSSDSNCTCLNIPRSNAMDIYTPCVRGTRLARIVPLVWFSLRSWLRVEGGKKNSRMCPFWSHWMYHEHTTLMSFSSLTDHVPRESSSTISITLRISDIHRWLENDFRSSSISHSRLLSVCHWHWHLYWRRLFLTHPRMTIKFLGEVLAAASGLLMKSKYQPWAKVAYVRTAGETRWRRSQVIILVLETFWNDRRLERTWLEKRECFSDRWIIYSRQ